MKKTNVSKFFAILLLIALAFSCAPKQPKEGIHTSAELKQLFANPPSEYRSAPLWDWN